MNEFVFIANFFRCCQLILNCMFRTDKKYHVITAFAKKIFKNLFVYVLAISAPTTSKLVSCQTCTARLIKFKLFSGELNGLVIIYKYGKR
jgi:hypothetical protein